VPPNKGLPLELLGGNDMKTDEGLEAVRKARRDISRELGNDPARLVAHYMEIQRQFKGRCNMRSLVEDA
jgi:hypothetical protein